MPYLVTKDKNSLLALGYINISDLFDQIGDYEKSLFYLDKAEVLSDKHNLTSRKPNITYRKGQNALRTGEYAIAKKYFLEIYDYYKKRKQKGSNLRR